MQQIEAQLSGVPDRLRDVIARSGLSQAKFAEFIGEDLQRLKDVLRGQTRPPAELVAKVIDKCSVDAMWFLSGRELDVGELSPTEKILIENYRALGATEREVLTRCIAMFASEAHERQKRDAAKR